MTLRGRMNLRLFLFLGLGGSTLFSINATANPSNEDISHLQKLDGQQQQRQQQQQAQQEKQQQQSVDIRLETRQENLFKLPQDESPCYSIKQIKLVDYTSPSQMPSVTSEFEWALTKASKTLKLTLPHCFGRDGLAMLMKQIQNHLIEKGYVTTRVVAQEQELQSGQFLITIIPGTIRNMIVNDTSKRLSFRRLNALTGFTFASGKVLNVRDIEQSLENLKRVPTVDANIEITPSEAEGAAAGESDLMISYAQRFPLRFSISLDDSGASSTGKYQLSGTVSIDNLLSANDLFYTTLTHSIKGKGDDIGKRASKNVAFYYSIPWRYWHLSISHLSLIHI